MTSTSRVCVSQPPTTGAGHVQFVTVPARRVERDEPVEAVVDGQVGVDEALERVRAGGERLRVGRVDRRAALRIGSRRVEADTVGGRSPPARGAAPARPCSRRRRSAPPPRTRRAGAPRARPAPAARCTRAARPSSRAASRARSAPRAPAACARRSRSPRSARGSPRAVSCFERIWARISRKTSATIRRASTSLHRRDDHALLEHLAERADRWPARRRRRRRGARGSRRTRAARPRDAPARSGATSFRWTPLGYGSFVTIDVARAEILGAVVAHRARHLLDHRAEVHGLGEALRDRAQLGVEERAREVRARLDVGRVRAPA